jgi:hypothetical protein
MNMFEPRRTTEDLFAVPTDASHADKLNVHKDVLIRKGTIVWDCDVQADRWVITVEREGQRRQFVSFRNPFGQTRGERLGAKFALHEPVKVKKLHPLLAGRHGKVIGYGAKVDTYQVELLGKSYIIAGEFLSPSKVTRCG